MKKYIIIACLVISLLSFASCGVSQSEYDKLKTENLKQSTTITELTKQLNDIKPPVYFENRNVIEKWLETIPKLGVSEDIEQWYQFAFYYQQKAITSGYIISVSYTINDSDITITCDIVTEDGWLYYFNPDDCVLEDSGIRVDMVEPEELEKEYTIKY